MLGWVIEKGNDDVKKKHAAKFFKYATLEWKLHQKKKLQSQRLKPQERTHIESFCFPLFEFCPPYFLSSSNKNCTSHQKERQLIVLCRVCVSLCVIITYSKVSRKICTSAFSLLTSSSVWEGFGLPWKKFGHDSFLLIIIIIIIIFFFIFGCKKIYYEVTTRHRRELLHNEDLPYIQSCVLH